MVQIYIPEEATPKSIMEKVVQHFKKYPKEQIAIICWKGKKEKVYNTFNREEIETYVRLDETGKNDYCNCIFNIFSVTTFSKSSIFNTTPMQEKGVAVN